MPREVSAAPQPSAHRVPALSPAVTAEEVSRHCHIRPRGQRHPWAEQSPPTSMQTVIGVFPSVTTGPPVPGLALVFRCHASSVLTFSVCLVLTCSDAPGLVQTEHNCPTCGWSASLIDTYQGHTHTHACLCTLFTFRNCPGPSLRPRISFVCFLTKFSQAACGRGAGSLRSLPSAVCAQRDQVTVPATRGDEPLGDGTCPHNLRLCWRHLTSCLPGPGRRAVARRLPLRC